MTRPARLSRPLLVLLLAVAGLLAPTGGVAAHATTTTVRAGQHQATAQGATTQGRAEQRSQRPVVAAAPTAQPAPAQGGTAADSRPGAPRLLLVQRPRPPTSAVPASALDAPTGRSPPSPAGT